MKAKLKIIIVGILCLFTIFLAAFTFVDYGEAKSAKDAVDCMAQGEAVCYVLREYEGQVAIFLENEPVSPLTVTDIQVSTLRELDRKLLETGIKLYSKERLMMTLEDLGS